MFGLSELKAKLLADSTVVSSTGTYTGKPAIYGKPLAPPKYSGKAITMSLTTPTDGSLDYGSYTNTVSCFAKKYNDAVSMQEAVFNALNRQSGNNESFFRCSKFPIIPPNETGGDYNAPVEVLVRQR